MEERKNGLPIVSLILSIIGCFFIGGASVSDDSMVGFGTLLITIAFICAIISLFNRNYKKVCGIIALLFCIISFDFFNTWTIEQAEHESRLNEYNSRTYTITFDTDGGQAIEPMVVHPNTYLNPVIPYKTGYIFTNWTLNGVVFNFSGYVNERITSDVTLKANYVKAETTNNSSNNWNNYYNGSTNSNSINTYQRIYNEYSIKLKNAGPTSSISEMAEILYEGVSKMAIYMYSAKGTDGQYATYQSWVDKLTAVYMNECR